MAPLIWRPGLRSTAAEAQTPSGLRWIEACARTVPADATGMPVRTAETVKAILSAAQAQPGDGPGASFVVLSNPEFLAECTAIADRSPPAAARAACGSPASNRSRCRTNTSRPCKPNPSHDPLLLCAH